MFTNDGEMILGIRLDHVFDFTTSAHKWEQETDKDIKALVYSRSTIVFISAAEE
jgi:hypothetical protein